MIVTCKQCATRFKLDSGRIKPSGTKVRCSSCRNVFRVYPAPAETVPFAASPEIFQPQPDAGEVSVGFADIPDATAAAQTARADDRWDRLPPEQGTEGGTTNDLPGGDPPFVFDLEALEIGPEIEQFEETAIDFDIGAETLNEMDASPAERFSKSDAADDLEGADSLDMQDLLDSLEVEDAPVEGEVSEVDIESFDLFAEDTEADKGSEAVAAASEAKARTDSLDPAEIEALLDMEGAVDASDGKRAAEDASAEAFDLEPEANGATTVESVEAADRPARAEEDAELNIDQLAQMIAGEEASFFEASPVAAADTPADDDVSPADREPEPAASLVGDEGGAIDGIDLAEIELFLDQEIAAERESDADFEAAEAEEDRGSGNDLDLGLDLELEEEPTPTPAGREDDSGTEFSVTDLQQMLENMPEDDAAAMRKTPVGAAAAQGDAGALDFTDIENLLEEEVDAPAAEEDADQDLELVLDFPSMEERSGAGVPGGARIESDEEELPDGAFVALDELLEEEASGEVVFDMDRDFGDIPDEFGSASVVLEGDDGLELETLTSFVEKEPVAAEPLVRARAAGPPVVEQAAKPFEMGGVDEDIFPAEEIGAAYVPAGRSRVKIRKAKSVRAPFWVILILVLLGGGGYAAYTFLDLSGIQIPFVDRFFKKEAADSGTLSVSLMNVKSRFVPNAEAGILFVISGQARNGYDRPRSYFEVSGTLKSKDGRPVKTLKAYCGNVLSDKDLSELDLASIQMRLNNRAGANRSNLNVKPNRSVPFMLVFSDLPADLGEFSVEPAGSAPAN